MHQTSRLLARVGGSQRVFSSCRRDNMPGQSSAEMPAVSTPLGTSRARAVVRKRTRTHRRQFPRNRRTRHSRQGRGTQPLRAHFAERPHHDRIGISHSVGYRRRGCVRLGDGASRIFRPASYALMVGVYADEEMSGRSASWIASSPSCSAAGGTSAATGGSGHVGLRRARARRRQWLPAGGADLVGLGIDAVAEPTAGRVRRPAGARRPVSASVHAGDRRARGPPEVGVSSALLGVRDDEGLRVEDAVTGILEGVRDTNRSLARFDRERSLDLGCAWRPSSLSNGMPTGPTWLRPRSGTPVRWPGCHHFVDLDSHRHSGDAAEGRCRRARHSSRVTARGGDSSSPTNVRPNATATLPAALVVDVSPSAARRGPTA